ncbi:cilia- and flagella-associated protein 263-like [Onthophagus taurus]|uniref:cilia- and flagella-associated protein 263-like n=1 Tax=Onthophagus taurus TaxID=166361 RepID=UPI0039BE6FFD
MSQSGLVTLHTLSTLSNHDFIHTVRGLQTEIKRINTENSIFVNFLNANEPALIERMDVTLTKVQEMQSQAQPEPNKTVSGISGAINAPVDAQSAVSKSVMDEKVLKAAKGPRINYSYRTDLLLREQDDIQTNLERFIKKTHLQKNRLIAEIEESGIRNTELVEARNNFETVVVIEGIEEITQKIPAEKFVRYMQEWLKFAQIMLEKLRLRTNSLRTTYNKLKSQLIQKEESGVSVSEVDFVQLDIANKNFLDSIEEKNKNLIELKQINGKASYMLSKHKNFLQKQQITFDKILETILRTNSFYERLDRDYDATSLVIEKQQEKYDDLVKLTSKYTVPDVMEYIKKKAELANLKKNLKVTMRKVNIQMMAMGTYSRTMCQLTGITKVDPSWFESTISTPDSISIIELSKAIPSFIHKESFFKALDSRKMEKDK